MRFGRGVGQRRSALSGRGAKHEILGRRHRGVVEPVPGRLQFARRANDQGTVGPFDLAAEMAQHLDMGIDLAHTERAALDVILDPGDAEPRQQRGYQHDRGAHLLGQAMPLRIEHRVAVADIDQPGREIGFDRTAERPKNLEDLVDVGDVGHAAQPHRPAGQQGRAQDRQHRVLVRRRDDPAIERSSAVHNEIGHVPFFPVEQLRRSFRRSRPAGVNQGGVAKFGRFSARRRSAWLPRRRGPAPWIY